MSQPDSGPSQVQGSSRLSAEAESFVPTKGRGGHSASSNHSGSGNSNISNQQLNELPRYVTTCYPFVTGDPGPRPRASLPWSGPGRPPAPNYTGQRMPAPQPGAYTYNGTRPPGPQNFGARQLRPQGYMPRHPFPAQPGVQVPFVGPGPLPGTGPAPSVAAPAVAYPSPQGYPPQYFPPYQPMGVPPQGWSPQTGPYPLEYGSQYGQGYYPGQFGPAVDPNESFSGSERSKSSERVKGKRKKSESSSNMVSIGIQNESGVHSITNNVTPKKKVKTKTIILMDAAIQTDFSDEIANLTLAEKPNCLFKKSKARMRRASSRTTEHTCTSTDSEEEVDSDSGYSSPLHRRNQANSGTHPVTGVGYVPSGLVVTDNHGVVHKQGGNFAYVRTSYAPANSPYTYPNAMAVNTGYQSPYLQGYQTMPGGVTSPNVNYTLYDSTTSNTSVSHGKLQGQVSSGSVKTEPEEDEPSSSSGKKKRRRNRRRKRKSQSTEDTGALSDGPLELHHAHSSSNVSRTSTEPLNIDTNDVGLHFEDEEEFPELQSTGSGPGGVSSQPVTHLSYSDILKSQPSPILSQDTQSASSHVYGSRPSSPEAKSGSSGTKETKNARKRRKRREQANRAADEELAEINLEQQVLKELGLKQHHERQQKKQTSQPQQQGSGKKSKQPISLNIAAMIDALERQQEKQKQQEQKKQVVVTESIGTTVALVKKPEAPKLVLQQVQPQSAVHNILDASAPSKRGKERENPKQKKPSPLKKVILKEREEKKRLRLLDDQTPLSPGEDSTGSSQVVSVAGLAPDSDLSQDGVSSKTSSMEYGTCTPASAELSPISQTSPISMSPLSPGGSPLSSGVNSPIASNLVLGDTKSSIAYKIHSRRFREYCNQVLDKDIDNCCTLLLQDLVRFQDRLYHKDPIKAKAKRRIVLGLREVTKHLKLKKIKCVIISPNLERIQSKGGLDDALNNIMNMCDDQDVPFVFALGRRALGRACAKLVPVSVVGIFNYEGAEEHFKSLIDLTDKARSAYMELVSVMEKEMVDNPNKPTSMPQMFAHMGHSRTPSACSAISFTSSILSEPISENYPYSEPETDSRGYEIIKNKDDKDIKQKLDNSLLICEEKLRAESPDSNARSDSPNWSSTGRDGKVTIVESIHEIDEGHEADVEDMNEVVPSPRREDRSDKLVFVDKGQGADEEHSEDTVQELPHIDSIHSSAVDLSAEILSQHSSKTLDLNAEAMSTHSSKTLGDGGSQVTGEPVVLAVDKQHGMDICLEGDENNVAGTHKVKQIDKERIESWVAETQHRLEELSVRDDGKSPTVKESPTPPPLDCIHEDEVLSSSESVNKEEEDKLNENTCNSVSGSACTVCDAKTS